MQRTILSSAAALLFVAAGLSAPAPARADASSACLAAAQANQNLHSYRAVMVSDYGGKSETSTVDIVKPDSFHVTGSGFEMIATGGRAWRRAGSSAWESMPGMSGKDIFSTSSVDLKAHAHACVDAGMGLWHGQPAHLYKSTGTNANRSAETTLYVFGDGLVHHADITTSSGRISMDFSEFNSATVEPPK
jgi:hypothetical protein